MKIENYSGMTVQLITEDGSIVNIKTKTIPIVYFTNYFTKHLQDKYFVSKEVQHEVDSSISMAFKVKMFQPSIDKESENQSQYYVSGLPDPVEGTMFIVSELVWLLLPHRTDLLFVRNGKVSRDSPEIECCRESNRCTPSGVDIYYFPPPENDVEKSPKKESHS